MRRLSLALAALLLSACAGSGSQTRESQLEAAEINLQLGIGYLRQDNLPAAQERLERAMQQNPNLPMAPAALGLVFERLEDPDGAERLYRRAAQLGPRDPDILNALAVFLCSARERPEEALRYFDRAIAVPLSVKMSNKAMLNSNAGTCARRIDPQRAEAYFRAALNHDAQWTDALYHLAELAWTTGEPLRARAFVERYLATGQVSPAVLLLGWQVERALDDPRAAADYARRLRSEFPRSQEARLLPDTAGVRAP